MLAHIVHQILESLPVENHLKRPYLIAIDGPAAAGKSSLAEALSAALACPVLHMDHFFLRPEQRVPSRLQMPGGNVDHERFLTDVLEPLARGQAFSYQPFDCKSMTLAPAVQIPANPIYIVEGAYACHPLLWKHYDLHIFLDTDKETQRRRILARNGPDQAEQFFQRWIPLEALYFSAFDIASYCELRFKN